MTDLHRYIIGSLYVCHGLLRSGLALMVLSSSMTMNFSTVLMTIGLAVPSLMGGYNLLTNNESAHRIMPLAAAINLISLPEGTALAIYYYWFWKYRCGAPNPFKAAAKPALSGARE